MHWKTNLSDFPARSARRRQPARRRPVVEALEGRALLALNFSLAGQLSGGFVSVGQHAVAIDAQGNTYLAGSFTGDVTFGKTAGGASVEVNNSQSSDEGFVVSYAPSGAVNWIAPFALSGSGDRATADSLVLDPANGTVYVAGTFTGTVNFDPAAGDTFQETSSTDIDGNPSPDAYVVGLSQSSGRVTNNLFVDFGQTFKSSMTVATTDVGFDASKNAVYVTGTYKHGLFFPITGPRLDAPSGTDRAGFVAKLEASNLSLDWCVNPLDQSFSNSFAVNAVAPNAANGVVYIVGDSDASGGTTSVVQQLRDSDGALNQMAVLTSSATVTASDVATSGSNAVVVGSFSGQLSSDNFNASLTTPGDQDAFIVALNSSSLTEVWGSRFGSSGTDSGDAVAVDGAGNVYVSGEDTGPASLGTSTTPVLHGGDTSSNQEAYVLQLSPSGTLLAGAQSTASGNVAGSDASSIAVTSSGKVAIAGFMSANVGFGSTSLTNPTATAFFANLSPSSSNGGNGGNNGGNGGGNGGGVGGNNGGSGGSGGHTPLTAPGFVGEQRVVTGRRRHKKVVGFRLLFSGALDAARAQSPGNYLVTQAKGRRTRTLAVTSATYDPISNSVTIAVAGFKANKAGKVTVTGLTGANGATIGPVVTGL